KMITEHGSVLSGYNPLSVNIDDPLTLVIVQIILIVVSTYTLHLGLERICRYIGLGHIRLPRAISEIISGIILGPSVLGNIPGYLEILFPEDSLPYTRLLADIGLVLYLFLVGVELNPKIIYSNLKLFVSISTSGIILPFTMGVGVAYVLYYAMDDSNNGSFASFVLFICTTIAITAFPVLARISSELKILRTPVGISALTSAVSNNIAAWTLLALAILINNAQNYSMALYPFLLCAAWTLIVGFVIRPILLKLIIMTNSNNLTPSILMIAITLTTVLISAFITSIIGTHYAIG
ncbi:5143_t:CDS:2, partial [Racocetra persica]